MSLRSVTLAGTMDVSSSAFSTGEAIPRKFTCAGANVSPALTWKGTPRGTRSLVLVMDDPDAPSGMFTHWLGWNIPPEISRLGEGKRIGDIAGTCEGRNDFGDTGYGGPSPPSGTHRYYFAIYALDSVLDLPTGSGREALSDAISSKVLAWGELMGTYERV